MITEGTRIELLELKVAMCRKFYKEEPFHTPDPFAIMSECEGCPYKAYEPSPIVAGDFDNICIIDKMLKNN